MNGIFRRIDMRIHAVEKRIGSKPPGFWFEAWGKPPAGFTGKLWPGSIEDLLGASKVERLLQINTRFTDAADRGALGEITDEELEELRGYLVILEALPPETVRPAPEPIRDPRLG